MTSDGVVLAAFYVPDHPDGVIDTTLDVCRQVGFDVDQSGGHDRTPAADRYEQITVPYDGWSIRLQFNQDEDRAPDEPVLSIGRLGETIYPSAVDDEAAYRCRMDVVHELVSRLAMALDAAYVPLFDSEGRSGSVLPNDRPIGESVESPPRLGVYSPSVVEEFGGLAALYEGEPWYAAELEDGRVFVIESSSPWTEGGWEPPIEADYITRAELREPEEMTRVSTVFDPFAALDAGEYGADVGVHPDDISTKFHNDVLQLARVYVDEDRNLRRVSDDSFVRNVVDEAESDEELVQGMLAEIPPGASGADYLVSALIHEAIPASFVRLDGPDDENVVTKVMDLDVDVNKYDLLRSLGHVASGEDFTDEDLRDMEDVLDQLARMGAVEGVEEWIEDRLL